MRCLLVLHLKNSKQTAADYYTVPQDETSFAAQWGEQVLVLSTCDKADGTACIFVATRRLGRFVALQS